MLSYGMISFSAPTSTFSSPYHSLTHHNHTTISSKTQISSLFSTNYPHNLPIHAQLSLSSRSLSPRPISCSSSPGPGEGDSRTVLDAFFLGKALGEALAERVESVVGEILSTVGRLQAEQQKQIQEFQEDVFERAKRAKERAAREALEVQGRQIPRSTTKDAVLTNVARSGSAPPPNGFVSSDAPATIVKPNGPVSSVDEDRSDQDPRSGIPIDE